MRTSLRISFLLILLPVITLAVADLKESHAPFITPHNGVSAERDRTQPIMPAADPLHPAYSYDILSNGTVRLNVVSQTSNDVSGDLIREALVYPQNGEILTEFALLDSGSIFTYVDDDVQPGKTYVYIFEYNIEGTSGYTIHFDTITVVSTIPALGNFLLIAPSNDEQYDWLREGYTIWLGGTNIQAEASGDQTGSVIFFLNGKQYKDNSEPFALFPETHGDFKAGHLKNGAYTLVAIAYPEKNGKGIPGDTATVSFFVEITYVDKNVTVSPNPVRGISTVLVNGDAGSPVTIQISGQSGPNSKTIYQGTLDETGALQLPLSSVDLKKGVYILSVDFNGHVIQTRILVE